MKKDIKDGDGGHIGSLYMKESFQPPAHYELACGYNDKTLKHFNILAYIEKNGSCLLKLRKYN